MLTLLVFPLLIAQTNAFRESMYQKTDVREDICYEVEFEESEANSLSMCMIKCSESVNCRRILYCEKDEGPVCHLYDAGQHCLTRVGFGTGCRCFSQLFTRGDGMDYRCPLGYYGQTCENIIKDCTEIDLVVPPITDGKKLITIQPSGSIEPFEVVCLVSNKHTEIALRLEHCTWINFNRTYKDYEDGFGNIGEEYFLGLNKLMHLFKDGPYTVLYIGIFFDSYITENYFHAVYQNVAIGNKESGYSFSAQSYTGWNSPAGDALLGNLSINGTPFSTYDNDKSEHDCPSSFGGGWWYPKDPRCSWANIFGPHAENPPMVSWLGNSGGRKIIELMMIARM